MIDRFDPDDDRIPAAAVLPWETVRAAALVVCDRCPDDAETILAALGLLDGDHLATLRTVKPLRRTVPKLRGAR